MIVHIMKSIGVETPAQVVVYCGIAVTPMVGVADDPDQISGENECCDACFVLFRLTEKRKPTIDPGFVRKWQQLAGVMPENVIAIDFDKKAER